MKSIEKKIKKLLSHSIFQGSFWMMGGGGFQAIVAFGSNLILVRLLTPEDFGRYALVQANISIIGAFLNMRTNDLLLQAPNEELEDPYNLSRYTGSFIFETISVGVFAVFELWLLDLLSLNAVFLLVSALISTWSAIQISLYEREFEYKDISIIETLAHFTGHIFAVFGAIIGWGAFVLYFRSLVIQFVKISGLGLQNAIKTLPIRWLNQKDWLIYIKKLRGFWADGLLERFFDQFVVVILGYLVSERVIGYFHQAKRLAITPYQLLQSVTYRMSFNYFSRQKSDWKRNKSLNSGLSILGILLLVITIIIVLLADPVIPWLFGQDWKPVVPLLRAMFGILIGKTLFEFVKAYYMSQNAMRNFMLFGRGGQYTGVIIALLIIWIIQYKPAIIMSFGLSAGYLVGTLFAFIVAHYSNKKNQGNFI